MEKIIKLSYQGVPGVAGTPAAPLDPAVTGSVGIRVTFYKEGNPVLTLDSFKEVLCYTKVVIDDTLFNCWEQGYYDALWEGTIDTDLARVSVFDIDFPDQYICLTVDERRLLVPLAVADDLWQHHDIVLRTQAEERALLIASTVSLMTSMLTLGFVSILVKSLMPS